jgi:aldehyde:ferredoxin oxidoreductase
MVYGYHNRFAKIDLTSGQVQVLSLEEDVLRHYLGGSGLAARLLFDEVGPDTEPLDPSNVIAFMAGPFAGTRVPTSNRFAVASRSPLTGVWCESDCGGRWAGALKGAGFDGLLISGRADKPVYLAVADGGVEIRDASDVWGVDTYDLDLGAEMVCIGVAGERMLPHAAIMSGRSAGRAAGRGGLGAVMGSKNLKAITASGKDYPELADADGLRQAIREVLPKIRENTGRMHDLGTSGGVETFERVGNLPIQNWRMGSWPEGAERISGQTMVDTILTGRYACGQCPIACGREVEIVDGPYAGVSGAGPEYETIGSLGSMCLIDDLAAIAKLNELCNRYGLDTIGVGCTVAFAMEAQEKGLIQGGPSWGDAPGAVKLVNEIADQSTELGRLMSKGVRGAAETLGGRALEFSIHVKGMELPMHDPRCYAGMAIGFATSSRGACHLQGFSSMPSRGFAMPELGLPEELERRDDAVHGALTADYQDMQCLFDSLKMCKFTQFGRVTLTEISDWLNLITGWDTTVDELMQTGERISNLKRLFSTRLGVSRKDDTLPLRLLTHRRGTGGTPENLPHLGRMLADYYAHRGWDEEGIPTQEKLTELSLA